LNRPAGDQFHQYYNPSYKNRQILCKHYHPSAQRALPAVLFGIIGEVGEIGGQRIALPRAFERKLRLNRLYEFFGVILAALLTKITPFFSPLSKF